MKVPSSSTRISSKKKLHVKKPNAKPKRRRTKRSRKPKRRLRMKPKQRKKQLNEQYVFTFLFLVLFLTCIRALGSIYILFTGWFGGLQEIHSSIGCK